jgi:hypothetical protein
MSENETAPSDVARIRFLIRAVTDAGFFDATPADRERFERIVAPTLPPALAAISDIAAALASTRVDAAERGSGNEA